MPCFAMRTFHTLQCNNSKASLQRTAAHWQLTHTWNPCGCVTDPALMATGETSITEEAKLHIPDSWGATAPCLGGGSEQAQRCFSSQVLHRAARRELSCSLRAGPWAAASTLALPALTNKWQQRHPLQTVCRTPLTRAWVNAVPVRFNILPCPRGFQKLLSAVTSAQCARVTLSAVSVLCKLYHSELVQ